MRERERKISNRALHSLAKHTRGGVRTQILFTLLKELNAFLVPIV
jgi:hypothetical protein